VAASLLCPEVLMNTWGLWQRIPPIAFVAAAGAIPWPTIARARIGLAAGLTAVALFASGAALAQELSFASELKGLREVAQDVPRGARMLWTPCGEEYATPRGVPAFRHLGAYVQAARGGDLAYSFAHFPHMVVRYRGEPLPE